MMKDVRSRRASDILISTLNELTDVLFEGSLDKRLRRFRSNFAFRGVADKSWDLRTSLMRLGGDYPRLEKPILRSFKKYAHRDAAAGDSDWNWLTVAQHHGLPTRLLDWTYSPYVAMHFATAELDCMGKDAAIWCVDFVATNHLLGPRLRQVLRDEYTNGFTVEMLGSVAPTLEKFDKLASKDSLLFFEPPSLDDRVVNQYALFSVMSNNRGQLDLWLDNHAELCRRVIIPSTIK